MLSLVRRPCLRVQVRRCSGVPPYDNEATDFFQIESDYAHKTRGKSSWGTIATVVYDKGRKPMAYVARSSYFMNTYHGEATGLMSGTAVALKLNTLPFLFFNDHETLVTAVKGGRYKGIYSDLVRRIFLLMSYTGLNCCETFHHMPRDENEPSHSLASFYQLRGFKRSYRIGRWQALMNSHSYLKEVDGLPIYAHRQFGSSAVSNVSNVSDVSSGQVGEFNGLCWVPDDPKLKAVTFQYPIHYGKPFEVIDPEDAAYFPGLDYQHWLIFLHPSFGLDKSSQEALLVSYIELASFVLDREQARKNVYSFYSTSVQNFFGFGCLLDQKLVELLETHPYVLFGLPDFHTVPSDYGGLRVVDGVFESRSIDGSIDDQAKLEDFMGNPVSQFEGDMKRMSSFVRKERNREREMRAKDKIRIGKRRMLQRKGLKSEDSEE